MVRGQKKFVAYYRVSTDKRGVRGLGMDARAAAVAAFVRSHDGRIFASFEEVESGRKSDRPQLEAAITRAKNLGATLLIADSTAVPRRLVPADPG